MSGSRYRSRATKSYRGRGGRYDAGNALSKENNPRSIARGLFADGIWQCDCKPRLPAEHFKVKKESKNQGRWFYTCQQAEHNRCGFFLWDDDAKVREEGAVLNNSRTELSRSRVAGQGMSRGLQPGSYKQNGVERQQQDEETETEEEKESPPLRYTTRMTASGSKRTAGMVGYSDDADMDDLDWPLNGQEAEELVNSAEAMAPETPRNILKTGVYATPATTTDKRRKLPWMEESAITPMTPFTPAVPAGKRIEELMTRSKSASHPALLPSVPAQPAPQTPELAPLATATTPAPPTRFYDALANPADSTSTLTAEVLAELKSVSIPAEVMTKVRSVLSKHDLKAQGVIKGRDISRLALKAKDAKIAELQARIASLDAEREVEKAMRRAGRASSS